MATAQKKSTASRSSGSSRSKKQTKQAKKQKHPIRRGLGGVLLLLLALCVGVGYFSAEKAVFINWLSVGLKGLFGYAYFIMLAVFLLGSYIMFFHRGRPVTCAFICTLLTPVFAAALWHEAFCKLKIESSLGLLKVLWENGLELRCGGVLGGSLAVGFHAVFGQVATVIILTVLMLICILAATRITPATLKQRWEERERLEYEEDLKKEEELRRLKAERAAAKERRSKLEVELIEEAKLSDQPSAAASRIDIPLDGEPSRPKQSKAAEEKSGGLFGGFFRAKPDHIRTPADVWKDDSQKSAEKPLVQSHAEPAVSRPAPVFPIREPAEEAPAPEHSAEKSRKASLGAAETAAESARIAAEIEKAAASEKEELYEFPPVTLLNASPMPNSQSADAELRNNARRLAETLKSFGVEAAPGEVVRGPSVTRYEFMLEQGVKLSKVTNLADDIALALGASGVRIAPIPNKISVVGIEVPNKTVAIVNIREIIESRSFTEHRSPVCFAVGKDIGGSQIVGDIAKLPHILIAGTTGSGKSVCTNSLIVSLMYKSSPEDVKFIMVDPKMVELAPYNGIPHLLIPVVTDPKKAAGALQWAVYEMMRRYKTFSEHGVKDLKSYNALAASDETVEHLPSVVVVIDELADLMLVAAKEVEESICRVAQMGRAAGMHLVIATQRPSADVITGLMKANIPSRIAFAVASSLESRIILDNSGAEKLVGRGDMLYSPVGSKPTRVQGCMITAEEIERVVQFLKEHSGEARYDDSVLKKIEESVAEKDKSGKNAAAAEPVPADDADELLPAAVEVILETGQASVSMLQRRLKLGYSRAARLVDQMEERGIVGPFEGSKPRQLLITRAQWQEMQMGGETVPGERFDDTYAPSEEDFSQVVDDQ